MEKITAPLLGALKSEMRSVLHAETNPPIDHLHGMMQYHMGWLDQEFTPAESRAGKQIRPLLCMLAAEAAGGSWQHAVPAGAAIELLHNFSLIHDDIEDDSPVRRGRNTLWKIWGVPLAINAGDAMFTTAHLAMSRLLEQGIAPEKIVHSLRRFDETCLRLTQGQHLDMDFETRDEVTVDEYIEMITGKTSVLIELSCELGAYIGGQNSDIVNHYAQYGLNLGLAFQVIDDILGIWGDEILIGKSASSDIETKKKTLPVLYGLANSSDLQALYAAEETGTDFVKQTIKLLDEAGARDYAEEKAAVYTDAARQHLNAANPSGEAGQTLHAITNMLLNRDQ